MGSSMLSGSPGRWFGVLLGIVGLIAARSYLRQRYTEVVAKATSPDDNPIWEDSPDWSEIGMEFDSKTLVQSYTFPGEAE